jgi:hypothetical protein
LKTKRSRRGPWYLDRRHFVATTRDTQNMALCIPASLCSRRIGMRFGRRTANRFRSAYATNGGYHFASPGGTLGVIRLYAIFETGLPKRCSCMRFQISPDLYISASSKRLE